MAYDLGDLVTVKHVRDALERVSAANNDNLTHETWTFTLDDDSTVTKEVTLWQSTSAA